MKTDGVGTHHVIFRLLSYKQKKQIIVLRSDLTVSNRRKIKDIGIRHRQNYTSKR